MLDALIVLLQVAMGREKEDIYVCSSDLIKVSQIIGQQAIGSKQKNRTYRFGRRGVMGAGCRYGA